MAAVRLQKDLRDRVMEKAKSEDLSFSQILRRSLRRELEKTVAENTPAESPCLG